MGSSTRNLNSGSFATDPFWVFFVFTEIFAISEDFLWRVKQRRSFRSMKNGKKYGKDNRKFSNIHNTYTYITISPLIQTYVHYHIEIDTVQKLRFGNIFNAFIFFWWSENCMLGVWINQKFKSIVWRYIPEF